MLVTSGPGATNAVTPLQDALMDSIPLVCISGQVPTTLIGSDAFQECDTIGITRPCTKHNWLVKDVNDLARILHEAFHVASTGRPGPVVVDIPKDIQFAKGIYTPPGWVGETAERPETQSAKFAEVKFNTGEIYANPAATQRLLDDSEINLENWLAGEVETEFAYQEGIAFVSGNGTDKPKGLLTYTAANSHPWGAIPTVNSGDAAGLTTDGLIDLVYDLPSERTPNARFAMNRKTQGAIRKMKDGQGNYIWQPGLVLGQPATVLGFPVSELAAMPDIAADAIPVVFGDFKRGYLVVDRTGVRILRDPYTNKPFVQFYTTKRVGGGVTDPTALRYHKIATVPTP